MHAFTPGPSPMETIVPHIISSIGQLVHQHHINAMMCHYYK